MILVGIFHLRVQNKKLYLATFAAVLGPLSFGFVLGYSSPAIPELRKIDNPKLRLDSNQASWFGVSFCMIHYSHDFPSWCQEDTVYIESLRLEKTAAIIKSITLVHVPQCCILRQS